MSLLGKFFSKYKHENPPSTDEAVKKLFELEEILKKKSESLEHKIDEQTEIAKTNVNKNKKLALKALQAKKHYEKQLLEVDGTLTTLEFQRENLQNTSTNSEILQTMSYAAKAFKVANKSFDLDKINELKDEVAEQYQLYNEISEAFVHFNDNEFEEDELLKELEELQKDNSKNALPNINKLPNVPNKELPSKEKGKRKSKEKDDFSNLMEWAS